MAVTAAYEIPGSGTLRKDRNGKKTYTEVWQVETDDVDDGPITVLAYASLPQIGGGYSSGNDSDSSAVVDQLRPRRIREQPRFWQVEVTYVYDATSSGWSGEGGSLTARLPEIEGFGIPYTEIAEEDVDGDAIAASCGVPFDPPAEKDANRHGFRVTRYVSSCPAGTAKKYLTGGGAINTDAIWAGKPWEVDPLHAKMQSYSYRRTVVDNAFVWQETLEIAISDEPWTLLIQDRSLYEAVHQGGLTASAITGVKRITDDQGVPVDEPQLLDGNGYKLAAGAAPVFLADPDGFHVYPELPFGPLNIPDLDPNLQ